MTKILPNRPIEKVMKERTSMRVSPRAVEMLREYVEEIILEFADEAGKTAAHAGRKTIQVEDMDFLLA